ncbi:MAG: BamA/TamA family outer membrane protein [Ignavibacteriaceae bacterium]|nr:BamA/TamA family outer membrane protein [Ignavibacteriaceae bacterium]
MIRLLLISFFTLIYILPLKAQSETEFELAGIEFKGNSSFPTQVLSGLIISKETPNWFFKFLRKYSSFGAPPSYFDTSYIDDDIVILKGFYNANGFFESSITSSYSIDSAEQTANLRFDINEGPEAKFGKFEYFGFDVYPAEYRWQVDEKIKIDSSSRYSESQVLTVINDLNYLLKTKGFLLSAYDSTIVVRDTIHDRADIKVYFTLGKQYRIKDVAVSTQGDGADAVDPELIKDLIAIKPYEYYDAGKITQSQVRLFRTGLFSYVRLFPETDSLENDLVPLKVEGSIGSMNELAPELIMNNEQSSFNLGGAIEYKRKNLFGGARKLTLRGTAFYQDVLNLNFKRIFSIITLDDTITYGQAEFKTQLEQPYFLGEPIFGSLEFTATLAKFGFYKITKYSGRLIFDYELPKFTFVNYLRTFYAVENVIATIIAPSFGNPSASSISAGFGANVIASHSDDIIFPTEGSVLDIYVEEGNTLPYLISKTLGNDFKSVIFMKGQVTNSFYIPLSIARDMTFAAKTSLGYIQILNGSVADLQNTKKFFVGGSNSLRGWAARAFPPPQGSTQNLDVSQLPGGTVLLEGSFEFRMRFGKFLGMAVFTDWGNTWEDPSIIKIQEIAVATGFGFRFYTPFAAVRLDFGFKTYDPYDRTPLNERRFLDVMQFHFGIGEAF